MRVHIDKSRQQDVFGQIDVNGILVSCERLGAGYDGTYPFTLQNNCHLLQNLQARPDRHQQAR
jgi:hypothetical protein